MFPIALVLLGPCQISTRALTGDMTIFRGITEQCKNNKGFKKRTFPTPRNALDYVPGNPSDDTSK